MGRLAGLGLVPAMGFQSFGSMLGLVLIHLAAQRDQSTKAAGSGLDSVWHISILRGWCVASMRVSPMRSFCELDLQKGH